MISIRFIHPDQTQQDIQARPGDTFEVSLDAFGQPLRNGIAAASGQVRPGLVKSL